MARATLFSIVLAATVLFACERRPGSLVQSGTVEAHGMTMLLQLYNVAHYYPERKVYVWCRSASTAGFPSLKEAAYEYRKLKIDSDGWALIGGIYVSETVRDGKKVAYEGLPRERVHILTPRVAYVDSWLGTTVTFDACKTHSVMSRVTYYQQLFTKGEVGIADGRRIYIDHRLTDDESGICLRMDPSFAKPPHTGFDVCTDDRGKSWYSKVSAGPLAAPRPGDREKRYSDTSVTVDAPR